MFLRSAAIAALLAGASLPAMAQEVELRLSHWLPASHPVQPQGIEPWIESIEEASEGRISISVFPASQLGAPPDHYDMARDGIADITYTNPGYQAGRFPIYSLIEIPFHVANAVDGARAIHEWYDAYAAQEMGDVVFCLFNPHDPGTLHSRDKVTLPSDIQGMRVRPAHATMARFVNELGGASVQVPAPEAREAIAKGAADAITFPWNSIYIFGIDSEVHHHLDMPFYISGQVLLINKARYESMSVENQAVMDAHCTPDWSARFSEGWAENEASGRDKMAESPDHTLHVPSEQDVQAWRTAAEPLLGQWKEDVREVGADPDAIYESYISKLEEHGVRY